MVKNTASDTRWQKAQKYEKHFWNTFADTLLDNTSTQLDWYQGRATHIAQQARPFLKELTAITALEIGPGPIGVINYFEYDDRYAIDPLEDYYNTRSELIEKRDPRVSYHQGTGEDISSLGQTFSFIIIDNVLDHVKEPQRVLDEICKNLESGGILFISINIYTPWGVQLRNLIEFIQIDKGHPFNFSKSSILLLLQKVGFKILFQETEDYQTQKKKYRSSHRFKQVVKSYLGLTDFRFSAICKKI